MALTKVKLISDGVIVQGNLHASHGITTAHISESTDNLYYTDARVDARVGNLNTGNLPEGSNLYYTNARADARIAAASTSDLSEGTNLYYTNARADARVALIVDSSPATLNTLNELAAALGDDPNFATTTANSIGTKLPLAGGTLTGNVNFNNSVRELKWDHTSGQSGSRAYGFIGEQGAYGRFALRSSNAADNVLDTDVLVFNNDLSATFAGDVTAGGTLTVNGTGNSAFGGQVFINGLSNYTGLTLTGSGGSRPAINFNNVNNGVLGSIFGTEGNAIIISTNGGNAVTINSSQNVGIGTESPASSYGFSKTLEIQGAANAEINISQSNNSKDWSLGITNGANYQQTTSGQAYIWQSGGTTRMHIRSSGTVGIGSDGFDSQMLTIAAGTLDGAIYATSTDANCFASFRDSSSTANIEYGAIGNAHVFRKDASEYMRIDGNGNVGIGTTSPDGKLEVAGGTTLGLRLSNIGDSSAYDQVRMTYGGYNSGAPTVTFMPLTTPGGGNVDTTFHFMNTNGLNANNNRANVNIDGILYVGSGRQSGETTLIMRNYDASLVNSSSIQNSIRMSGRYWSGSASQLIETRINSVHQESNGNGGSALTFWTQTGGDAPNEKLRIDRSGRVIVYQKQNVSGFYLDGGNTRLYANGGGGTDYRGIECNSSGMWSWGETGSSNYFAKPVGIGITSPNTKLDVSGPTGTRNRSTTGGSSVYETSLYFGVSGNSTANVSIDTSTVFPPMASGGFILVEVSASGYGNSGSNGLIFSYITGGYGGHYAAVNQPYHPVAITANSMQAGTCTWYNPNPTTIGITVTTTNSAGLNGLMRVKVTTTY